MQNRSPVIVLSLIAASLLCSIPAMGGASFGPIVWSADGSRITAYHRHRIAEMTVVEGDEVWLTDSIPPPRALAVYEADRLLIVAPERNPPSLDFYSPGDLEAVRSLVRLPGPVDLLRVNDQTLLIAGAGYMQKRSLPDGGVVDSLRWDPPRRPVDLAVVDERELLLLPDRLVRLNGAPRFDPILSGGEAIALGKGEKGPTCLVASSGVVLLLSADGERSEIIRLEREERVIGGAFSPSLGLVALAIHVDPGANTTWPSRLDFRDAVTGELRKRFRSARIYRDIKEFEDPTAFSLDPSRRLFAVVWPSSGSQIRDTGDWGLEALY